MKLGFLYAGQGSQHAGMGADLYEAFSAFRAVYDHAEVDFDLKKVTFEDPDGIINQTRYTQPCMVAFAAGMTAVLREKGITPAVAAGLSLGEYSALHAAGVFNAATAIRLVAFRGKAMEEAAAGRESAMMAVLNLDRSPLQDACDAASLTECLEEAGLSVRPGGEACAYTHVFTHKIWDMQGFWFRTEPGACGAGMIAADAQKLKELSFPSAMRPFLDFALRALEENIGPEEEP